MGLTTVAGTPSRSRRSTARGQSMWYSCIKALHRSRNHERGVDRLLVRW